MENSSRKILIIDTDCGVDDALAIMLALNSQQSGQSKILAFTTVQGNTSASNAAQNVLRLTNYTNNRQIPVYVGCESSLLGTSIRSGFHGPDGFGGVAGQYPTGNVPEKEPAPMAMTRMVAQYPRQVTLVALGPLTNVAVAQLLDPNFSSNLKELCIMGGNVEGIGNVTVSGEFNFYCDPEAVQNVLNEFKCPIDVLPWELSFRQTMDWTWYVEWIEHPTKAAKIMNDVTRFALTRDWKENYPDGMPVPDLLAVAVVLNPDLISQRIKEWVSVELTGTVTRGMMVIDRRVELNKNKPKGNISIVTRINLEALKLYLLPLMTKEWIQ